MTMEMATATLTPEEFTDLHGMLGMGLTPLLEMQLNGLMLMAIHLVTTPAGLLVMLVLESPEPRIKTGMVA